MQLSTHDSPPLRRCLSAVSKLTFSKSKGNLYHSRFIRGRIPFLSSPSFPLLFLLFNSSELVSICYRTSIALLSMHALKPLLIVWKQTSVCFSLTMPSESRFFPHPVHRQCIDGAVINYITACGNGKKSFYQLSGECAGELRHLGPASIAPYEVAKLRWYMYEKSCLVILNWMESNMFFSLGGMRISNRILTRWVHLPIKLHSIRTIKLVIIKWKSNYKMSFKVITAEALLQCILFFFFLVKCLFVQYKICNFVCLFAPFCHAGLLS